MTDHDDTRQKTVIPLTPVVGGHYVGLVSDGRIGDVVTHEHACKHHADELESGLCEPVTRVEPRQDLAAGSGPAQVASETYCQNWDRISWGGVKAEA